MVTSKKLLPCFLLEMLLESVYFFSLKCKSPTVFLALRIYMTLFIRGIQIAVCYNSVGSMKILPEVHVLKGG